MACSPRRPALLHDGLIGYFTNKTDGTRDYSRFYSHHPDPTRKKYTAGIEPKNLSLTPQDATKPEPAKDLTLTLLVCPDRPVHAVTDIVPVTQLAIPQTLIDKALSAIRPAFPSAPPSPRQGRRKRSPHHAGPHTRHRSRRLGLGATARQHVGLPPPQPAPADG
ncbi:hypothetical protein E4K10_47240 [Streptomyces sp. T1317-0309]|nr:hypothetical protein E4K10_47240 [Streptomyces sp. T1317-0309]